jgi:hypothetical protein
MTTAAAHHHRLVRLHAVVCVGLSLVLAQAAAASAAAARGGLAGTHAAAGARVAAHGGTWGTAMEVPGITALNKGGTAAIDSVSCARAGTCSAGGFYTDASGHRQALVAGEVRGVWGKAQQVPGTAALNKGDAEINSVSCGRAGTCSAGGAYADASGHRQAFVAGEVKGIWGTAIEVPGTAALNKGGIGAVDSVSCARAGTCSAGGSYLDASRHLQAFVAGEVKGVWGKAQELPGIATLNKGGDAAILSVSCARAGACSAGGFYVDASGHRQAFVVGEVKGVWGKAQRVPGTAALNKGGDAVIGSVSCARAGTCSAGGIYTNASGHRQAFVVGEVKGIWGTAMEVPGAAALNKGGVAAVGSVSCARAGTCSAGGFYAGASGHLQAFVAGEVKGVWGKAQELPGIATLNKGGNAQISSVSCGRAGNCSAGGFYTDASDRTQAFVAGEVKSIWGKAQRVPGTPPLNTGGGAAIDSVSCARARTCSAGGAYADTSGHFQAFVVTKT